MSLTSPPRGTVRRRLGSLLYFTGKGANKALGLLKQGLIIPNVSSCHLDFPGFVLGCRESDSRFKDGKHVALYQTALKVLCCEFNSESMLWLLTDSGHSTRLGKRQLQRQ